MDTSLISKLLEKITLDTFAAIIQIIVVGGVVLYLKDLTQRIINYIKLRLSDFGRGTKVTIEGRTGFITEVNFKEVEIKLDDESLMLIPVSRFLMTPKIIHINLKKDQKDSSL